MFERSRMLVGRAALALAAVSVLAACGNSTGSDDDDHREPVGMVITDEANTTLVSINAARQVTGALSVRAGQARHLDVYFVDEDGDRFQLDEDDDEFSLGVTVANQAIARIDAHGDHMDLQGVAAGATTVEFRLMHGNHPDYTAPAIPITVTP